MRDPMPSLSAKRFPAIRRSVLRTLQVNVGYRCNQSCVHCHVSAGPNRTEMMTAETAREIIAFIEAVPLETFDITGGAPEMNPHFRSLVDAGVEAGLEVIDRCNLTILSEPGYEGTAEYLAERRVRVVASLPCYTDDNVDAQRGKGVFDGSIEGLRKLNELGYGVHGSGLTLDLVYNPLGTSLPPPQAALEADYKRELHDRFGVSFSSLLTLANVPVGRFGSMLASRGELDGYLDFLQISHSDANLDGVMCRSTLSIDWEGQVYDCDFNQMLNLPLPSAAADHGGAAGRSPAVNNAAAAAAAGIGGRVRLAHVKAELLEGLPIVTRGHCYACTAGQGSSCGGALA